MGMKDRISSLPDEILCHILSFLLTKEVVATSILSKRWKPLWLSVSTLDFEDSNNYKGIEKHYRFVQFVYRVILSRDFNQPIQKLRLSYLSQHLDPSNVSVWINAALQRRVQHLNISLCKWYNLSNSSPVFSSKTLVVLKLEWFKMRTTVSSVDLPSLKVLHLKQWFLPRRVCLTELLYGCPVLEELKARYIYFDQDVNDGEFNTLPKLVRADVSESITKFGWMKVLNNVQFLRMHRINHRLPHGGELTYMFHNLTHLELVYTEYNSAWFEVVEFLKYCPKLQVLVINQLLFHYIKLNEIKLVDWQDPPSVPKCILLYLKECYLNDYRGTKGEFQFAKYIMQNGRILKKMTICSSTAMKQPGKDENIQKLSSCTMCSSTCKLSFN